MSDRLPTSTASLIMSRRHEMVERILFENEDPKTVYELLASKYSVSVGRLANDWSERKTWIDDIISQENAQLIIFEVLHKLNSIYNDATAAVGQLTNQSAKVSALRLKRELTMDVWRIYTELGKIKVETSQISEEGLTHMEWLKNNPSFFDVKKRKEEKHDSIESSADSGEKEDRSESSEIQSISKTADN